MWISDKIFDLFEVAKENVAALREELAAVKAERDALKIQSLTDRTNNDWLRTRINALEMERAGLLEKAYQIRLPSVPQIARASAITESMADPPEFSFDHIEPELAKKLGLPLYDFEK